MPQLNQALAEKVSRHMHASGLSQIDVAGRGGPSTTTLTKITKGEGSISSRVLRQLDQGLGWAEGTSAQVLAGPPARSSSQSLSTWTDDELLDEIRHRMQGGGGRDRSAANTDAGETPAPAKTDYTTAARRGRRERSIYDQRPEGDD